MQNHNLFSVILIVLSFLGLVSCEGETQVVRTITNNTSSTISIDVNLAGGESYSVDIPSGESELLYYGSKGLGASEEVEGPSIIINSMTITNQNNDTCNKDYTVQNNWDISVKQTKRVPSIYRHNYSYIAYDNDF